MESVFVGAGGDDGVVGAGGGHRIGAQGHAGRTAHGGDDAFLAINGHGPGDGRPGFGADDDASGPVNVGRHLERDNGAQVGESDLFVGAPLFVENARGESQRGLVAERTVDGLLFGRNSHRKGVAVERRVFLKRIDRKEGRGELADASAEISGFGVIPRLLASETGACALVAGVENADGVVCAPVDSPSARSAHKGLGRIFRILPDDGRHRCVHPFFFGHLWFFVQDKLTDNGGHPGFFFAAGKG